MTQPLSHAPSSPPPVPQPKWHVLGAGAMGSLWAVRLAQAIIDENQVPDVTLILRDDNVMDGYPGHITVETANGDKTKITLKSELAQQITRPIDRLLVTTKAFDTNQALLPLMPLITSDSKVFLLQNGIRNHLKLQERLAGQVMSMTTSHGAWLRQRFHVVHAGVGQTFFGPLHAGNADKDDDLNTTLFPKTLHQTMNIHFSEDMNQRLWQKFAANCAINGLTVMHDCQNGELLSRPRAHQELKALCEEIDAVLTTTGHLAAPCYPLVRDILQTTASNWSSSWQDVKAGRTTEIGEFNGFLAELAEQSGTPAPKNQALLNQLTSAGAVIR